MATSDIKTKARECSIRAVVTRADGTVEDLGLVAYRSTNPFKVWVYNMGKRLGIWRK